MLFVLEPQEIGYKVKMLSVRPYFSFLSRIPELSEVFSFHYCESFFFKKTPIQEIGITQTLITPSSSPVTSIFGMESNILLIADLFNTETPISGKPREKTKLNH